MNKLQEKLNSLPQSPGVYQFYDNSGRLLYIGKAKLLKNRVAQYFRQNGDDRPMIGQLVRQIAEVRIVETDSEIEALILESELIRHKLPKYNIRLKDDKTFLMIKITKEDFPKIELIRYQNFNQSDNSGYYVGPYVSGDSLRKALKYLRKFFLFADCNQKKSDYYQKKGRPCLFGMINQCQAPCQGFPKGQYNEEINYLKLFLKGKKRNLVNKLKKQMIMEAKNKNFEQATDLRNKINALENLNKVGIIKNDYLGSDLIGRIEAYDISNISGHFAVGSMAVILNGELEKSEYRCFKIKTVKGPNDTAMIAEILERRFSNNWPIPSLIVIDGGWGQFNAAQKVISKEKINIKLLSIAKGADRHKDELILIDQTLAKLLKKDDNLIKQIKMARDEAHRFAVNYFRKRMLEQIKRETNEKNK